VALIVLNLVLSDSSNVQEMSRDNCSVYFMISCIARTVIPMMTMTAITGLLSVQHENINIFRMSAISVRYLRTEDLTTV
jgi:hypothetical protein